MRNDDDLENEGYHPTVDKRLVIPVFVVALLLILIVSALLLVNRGRDSGGDRQAMSQDDESDLKVMEDGGTDGTDTEDGADPQNGMAGSMSEDTGMEVNVAELLTAGDVAETEGLTVGVDVAKYQGTIDWQQVADAGIDFAMVRVGYRTQKTGEIAADSNARYNMQEAQAHGIKVGVYFFSTAVNVQEAVEEADWVADYVAQYRITYPVAYDCEGFADENSRQYSLTQAERTDVAMAFLNRIYERGYTPMFYAAREELLGDAKWDTSRLEQSYRIWMAWYADYLSPMDEGANAYVGDCAMWQYTNQGTVPGIGEKVDINVAYFAYEGTADAKSDIAPEYASADAEALMNFSEVNETVTAKERTNLRDIPSQGNDSTVIATITNGETATRTGVSSSGWSRVEYNGQVCYAVSSYLTTDLSYQPPASGSQDDGDGIKTQFAAVNDVVTAKIEVNLRTLPSVTNPDSAVVAVLHNGETVTRTGINNEYGWSRVEYNGQTLYCISSYLTSVQ